MYKARTTKDYKSFKSLKGNRTVKESHVKKLEVSLNRKNLNHLLPIIVNEKMEIIDGQHRKNALQNLWEKITYVMWHGLWLKDVEMLNSTSKNRALADYLEAFCELEMPEYLAVKDFLIEYWISISVVINLLAGKAWDWVDDSRAATMWFKNWTYKITNLLEAEYVCSSCKKMSELNKKAMWWKFVVALYQCMKKWMDMELFIKKFNLNSLRLVKAVKITDYISIVEKIYNWNNQNKFYHSYRQF